LERHDLQVDGLKDEVGGMLGGGVGVGVVGALVAATKGGGGSEVVGER
jgi:hypothetical protein